MRKLSSFLVLAVTLAAAVIVTISEANACGGFERRQARRQSRRAVVFEPAAQVTYSYMAVPIVQTVATPVVTISKADRIQCENPDCKCGPGCSCAEYALSKKAATSALTAPQLSAGDVVCENGVCYRRGLVPRIFRR